MWTWQRLYPHGRAMEYEKIKLVQRASSTTADLEFKCQLAPVQPTTLCPLIQLWGSAEERRPRRSRKDESHTTTVAIIASPAELELYCDMIFADHPSYEARAKMCYEHSRLADCYIPGERVVRSDSPLHGARFPRSRFSNARQDLCLRQRLRRPRCGPSLFRHIIRGSGLREDSTAPWLLQSCVRQVAYSLRWDSHSVRQSVGSRGEETCEAGEAAPGVQEGLVAGLRTSPQRGLFSCGEHIVSLTGCCTCDEYCWDHGFC